MARKKNEVPSRKAEFLATGAKLASKIGVNNVTRRAIAEAHSVSDPLVGKHVGGKDDLRKGIKSTMKKLGLVEPDADTAAAKGKALRARKAAPAAKKSPAMKPSTRATRGPVGASGKKATAAKKSKKTARLAAAGTKPASTTKRVASPAKPADPKKGAPSRKVLKKAPSNKNFAPKLPPLPALPTTGQ